MRIYLRLKQLCAVYLEISQELGLHPTCDISKMSGELIMHLPYCTVIITPHRILRKESETTKHGPLYRGYDWDEKRNRRLPAPPARATKD